MSSSTSAACGCDGSVSTAHQGQRERSVYSQHKARYSYLDARRWANPRELIIKGPLVYDTRPALIGGRLAQLNGRLIAYRRKAYQLFCSASSNPIDPTLSPRLIDGLGISADGYRVYLEGQEAVKYERAQRQAADDHVFGVPLLFFADEPFGDHDRLPILEQRLVEAGLRRRPIPTLGDA